MFRYPHPHDIRHEANPRNCVPNKPSFRVDVAVAVDRLDHIRNRLLVSSPTEHVQHHRERGGTAVVRGLLFVRWGAKKRLRRRRHQCGWNRCCSDLATRGSLASWACNAGRRRCIWDRCWCIINGIEHVPCIGLCDFIPPCEAAVARWDLKNQHCEQEQSGTNEYEVSFRHSGKCTRAGRPGTISLFVCQTMVAVN